MLNTILQITGQGAWFDKAAAVLRLTRWREHVPFTIPLTVVGAMLAVNAHNLTLDWRLLFVTIANILAMCFAFMINDVVDAPDDALNPKKKARNPISSGILTYREGVWLSGLTFAAALMLYAVGGGWAFSIGILTLVLCLLYSMPPFRLKAHAITDVTSHALMLSGLLVMAGYFTYHNAPGAAWLVIFSAICFSAGGQFYNQIDDYEVDKAAGLKNTVVLLGKAPTQFLMYFCMGGAVVFMVAAILAGAFPAWLGTVALITAFVTAMFTWETDMRGNQADMSGAVQKPGLMIANIVTLIWVAQTIGMMG